MIKASAPGKLYIAGEYAVLEPGNPALIVALDQFITVTLKPADKQGSIRSSYSNGISIPWTRKNGKFYMDERDNPFSYIAGSVTIVESYLKELGLPLKYFDLTIESELDNKDGRKYGLGSSGAVTIDYDAELLYKLSAITHLSLHSNGSFGDLAASSFEGWVAYSCFEKDWVLDRLANKSISLIDLLKEKWPKLMIEPLEAPTNLDLYIGWTGTPASTTLLVDTMNDEQHEMNGFYRDFLKKSADCVTDLIEAFKQSNIERFQEGIRLNRSLLTSLAQKSGVDIETEALLNLCQSAEEFGGAAKSSGAGGGDCGIVLFKKEDDASSMLAQWETHGITNLPLKVYRTPNTTHQSIKAEA